MDNKFRQLASPCLIGTPIEVTLNNSRYLLLRRTESPILKAIPEKQRFKPSHSLGTTGTLALHHEWQAIETSTKLDMCRSDAFDTLANHLKIGFSPYADGQDMHWACDAHDPRGINSKIPFWCCGTKTAEAELLERISGVLAAAYQANVHILLFPELVMTENLQSHISQWLRKNNAFAPQIRLVVAGTRHVHADNPAPANTYSNRCSVFNSVGGLEWQQDKRQSFDLTAEQTQALFGIAAPAFEPTDITQHLTIRNTTLGAIATAICLDFLQDKHWKTLPIAIFLVPAMSEGLSRFKDRCRAAGNAWGSTVLVCNAHKDATGNNAVLAYRPEKADTLQLEATAPFLFTVHIDIKMN
jgi:predicted amidohydrolase